MATDAYDSTCSNSQLIAARARLDGEFNRLDGGLKLALNAAEGLRELGKSLILKTSSGPMEGLGLDERDRVNELVRFLECAYLGAEGLGPCDARDGLQAVLTHVIFGLKDLSKDLNAAESHAA